MGTVVQVVGALLILAAFLLAQRGVLGVKDLRYLALNAVGAGILAMDAWLGRDWGFLLLEGTWSLVALVGLITEVRTPREG